MQGLYTGWSKGVRIQTGGSSVGTRTGQFDGCMSNGRISTLLF